LLHGLYRTLRELLKQGGLCVAGASDLSNTLMDEKDPTVINLASLSWVLGLSGLGGLAAYLHKLKKGHTRAFSVAEFIGEGIIACFAGLITFLVAKHYNVDPVMSHAMAGIAGHMGSRAIEMFEKLVFKDLR
jgi:hypothetical protein